MNTNIERICEEVYGVGIAAAPVETVLWACERISDIDVARQELSRANKIRAKHGKPLAHAPWGHHAF